LCGARKLTHVACLRRDPLVPELLAIRRVASQSTLSRFFAGFGLAGLNLRCFRPLRQWGVKRLPSRREGCTLDLDSTRLLHEDGQQEGVAVGYTKRGLKPCPHPLLAVLAEVRLVAQFWLRAGNAACGNNAVAFFLDLWDNLPRHIRLPELLALWEGLRLPWVVAAQLSQPTIKAVPPRERNWWNGPRPGKCPGRRCAGPSAVQSSHPTRRPVVRWARSSPPAGPTGVAPPAGPTTRPG
jgi:hypothetical protein